MIGGDLWLILGESVMARDGRWSASSFPLASNRYTFICFLFTRGKQRVQRSHKQKKNRFLFIQLIIQFYLCFIQEHDMEYSKLLLNFVECLEKLQSSNEKGV